MRTPEGLCTACSATQYCREHEPPAESEIRSLRQQIAEAREACPAVRMERFFDASLLELINEQVSQLFRMQSRAEQAEAALSAARAVVPPEGLRQLRTKIVEYQEGTQVEHGTKSERLEVAAVQATLRVVLAEIDALLSALDPLSPNPTTRKD